MPLYQETIGKKSGSLHPAASALLNFFREPDPPSHAMRGSASAAPYDGRVDGGVVGVADGVGVGMGVGVTVGRGDDD